MPTTTLLLVAACLIQGKTPPPQPIPLVAPVKTIDGLRPLAFAPADRGSKFLMTLADNTVRIMDSNPLGTIKVLQGHPQPCYAVAWSKDGKYIATGDESARIWIWVAATGEKIKEFRSHPRGIQKLSFNADHSLLVSTGREDAFKVYDLKKWKELGTVHGGGASFFSATFHPKTNEIAVPTLGESTRLYKPDGTLKALLTTPGGTGMFDADYNKAGTRIATCGKDGTVVLWDAKTHGKIQTLHGATDWNVCVRWSPNGRYVAASSTDRNVRVWDTKSYKLVATLTGQSAIGSPLCWTADGKYLMSVNEFDFLQVNKVTPPQGETMSEPAPRREHYRRRHRR